MFDDVEVSVNGEEKIEKKALERSEAAAYAMRLLTLELSKQMHCLLGNSVFHSAKNDEPFERRAVQKFSFKPLALPLVFAAFGDRTARPSQLERPAGSPAKVEEVDDERNAVRRKTFSIVQLSVKSDESLVFRRKKLSVLKVKEVSS